VYVCRLFVCSHGLFCKIKSRDCKGFKAQFEEIEEAFIDHSACVSEDMGNSHTLEMLCSTRSVDLVSFAVTSDFQSHNIYV